ncbi:alpha/beta hydrolase, partial [Rhodanobacter denitrificans]|nr:alpha/beta hydrolase [Rhodanobacter denitrificans]
MHAALQNRPADGTEHTSWLDLADGQRLFLRDW